MTTKEFTVFDTPRGFVRGSSGLYAPMQVHPDTNDLLVAQGLPEYAEITRLGGGYSAMATAAVAALVVRPTTVAMPTLHNNESPSGKTLIIDEAFAHNLVGTANSVYSIWLCLHPVGMAAPTNDITVRNSHSGKVGNGTTKTIFDNGATVLNDGWFPWSLSEHTVTITTPGGVIIAPVKGRLLVPPTAGISLHVVADVVGATFTAGFRWFEKVLTVVT